MKLTETIIQYFISRDENGLLEGNNILDFNYFETQFFNSIGFIEMISYLEEEFSITFTDEHLKSADFMIIGGLISTVERLVKINSSIPA